MADTDVFADLVTRAIERHDSGRIDEAAELYEQALEWDPDNDGLLIRLGVAHRQAGRPGAALSCFRKALAVTPEAPGLHFNIGNVLADLGRLDEAAERFRQAVALDPQFADAHNNLGDVLVRQGDAAAAMAVFQAGLSVAPDHPGLHANLGNAAQRQGDAAAAIAHLRAAADLAPADPMIARNLANVLRTSGRHAEAEAALDRLLADRPDDAEAHCLRAMTLFSMGRIAEFWPAYRWRWRSPAHEPARPFPAPPWDGSDPSGRRLLVWGEQAVGDELMFATLVPELIASGARVVLECEHRLAPLFRRSFPDARIFVRTEPPAAELQGPDIDAQIAIGDLGGFLRPTRRSFAGSRPYLRADPETAASFVNAEPAAPARRPRIGISWRSGSENPGTRRSAPLDAWLPVLGIADCHFINLQYGDVSDELRTLESAHGVHVANDASIDPLLDLDRFAALVTSLDLVISVANTTVHVSGALGVPTWTLLSSAPDWRWMADGERSPWYREMTLLRTPPTDDWDALLKRVAGALRRQTFD